MPDPASSLPSNLVGFYLGFIPRPLEPFASMLTTGTEKFLRQANYSSKTLDYCDSL